MPGWLRKLLENGATVTVRNRIKPDGSLEKVETVSNEVGGTVPVLAQLCQQDATVKNAYLCHPCVEHIVKLSREGGFCGYRNIQMMVSYLQGTQTSGWEHFQHRSPGIFQLQDMIEHAWDCGFNSQGRVETSGIRGTRKYIGTSEVGRTYSERERVCSAG